MFSTLLCTHLSFFFFFNDTATTEIYTLSLHDALPICALLRRRMRLRRAVDAQRPDGGNALVVRAPAGRALARGEERAEDRARRRVLDDAREPVGQAHHLAEPVEHPRLQLGRGRRGPPEHALG